MDRVEKVYFAGDVVALASGIIWDVYFNGHGWGTILATTMLERRGRLSQDIVDVYDSGVGFKHKLASYIPGR